jgi:hypothetical protein
MKSSVIASGPTSWVISCNIAMSLQHLEKDIFLGSIHGISARDQG